MVFSLLPLLGVASGGAAAAAVAADVVLYGFYYFRWRPDHSPQGQVQELSACVQQVAEVVKQGSAQKEAEEQLHARQRAEEMLPAIRPLRELAAEEATSYPAPAFLQPGLDRGTVAIAVAGQSGSGKSSLINALRKVRPLQEGWAPTGITQTTLEPKAYRFTTGRNIRGHVATCELFDLPGFATDHFPAATYAQEMGLRHFDLVIIATGGRFTEGESSVIRDLKLWSVPCFLVRTSIDKAIQDGEDDKDMSQEEVLQECRAALADQTDNVELYCVASTPKHWEDYDLPTLRLRLTLSINGSRGVDVERACPICEEVYQDYGGGAGLREYAEPCGHGCCAACWAQVRAHGRDTCPLCRVVLAPAPQA